MSTKSSSSSTTLDSEEARPAASTHRTSTLQNKIGLGLGALIGAVNVYTVFVPPTAPGEVGPPMGILVFSALLGVTILACVGIAVRTGSRGAIRLAAGCLLLAALSAAPAFFAGLETSLVVAVAIFTVLTVVAVVCMLARPSRRTMTLR